MTRLPVLLLLLTALHANSQQTFTIKSAAGNTFSIEPATTNQPNTNIHLVIGQNAEVSGAPALTLHKDGNRSTLNPSGKEQGPYDFDALKGGQQNPDSMFIQAVIGGQLRLFKIFQKATPLPRAGAASVPAGPQPAPPPTLPVITKLAPGNLVYDALRLGNKDSINKEEIVTRINYYYGSTNTKDLAQPVANNLFLQQYLDSVDILNKQSAANVKTIFQSFLSQTGGLDVTNFADGLAKFLVKRVKQELSTAFFTKFREDMEKEQYKDLRILFHATYSVLKRIDRDIYMFDAYKLALIEAFEKDLKNILTNLPKVIEDGTFREWFNNHKEIKALVLSGLYIYNSLADGQHPGQVIEAYPVSYLDGIDSEMLAKGTVQTVQQFSYALRATSSERYWISVDSIEMLFKNYNAVSAFMGLLWIKAEGIKYTSTLSLQDVINQVQVTRATEVPAYKKFFTETVNRARTIESTLRNLKEKKNSQGPAFVYEDYYGFANQVFDFTDYFTTHLITLPRLNGLGIDPAKALHYINVGRLINETGLDVATRNYASGIVNLTNLYDTLTEKLRKDPPIGANVDNLMEKKKEILRKVLRYGTMMAGVAAAKNSDDVEKAIEAVALPAGSARVKRESICNISLNAYVGVFAGHERMEAGYNKVVFNSYGITAPVGVSFAWGSRTKKDSTIKNGKIIGGKSNGIFVSLIDIGAVTALRFGDTTTTKLPTIQLKNIIAPGIFYSHGFGKCPLSMNIGVQYGAALRKITASELTLSDKGYVRFGISLLVDIPLLNLYNKN